MEHITVAGHPEPISTSPIAAKALTDKLAAIREERGAEAADEFEQRVGERIGQLLSSGTLSIDLANMRAIVRYLDTPAEEEDDSSIGRAVRGVRERLAQRGGASDIVHF
ncbi:hypothetical protein ACXET9_15255 [Brachybacterium sp. DNPG3]